MMELKHFTLDEFNCKQTGENKMSPVFLEKLDELREKCGFPFVITSGFRSVKHTVEMRKPRPGVHSKGIAADIQCADVFHRYKIVQEALAMGFTGVGVGETFVHVDIRDDEARMWLY